MAISFGPVTKGFDTITGSVAHTLTGFAVSGGSTKVLFVAVFHEDAVSVVEASGSYGSDTLTKVGEIRQASGNQAGISLWAKAQPTDGTATITINTNTAMSVGGMTIAAWLVDGLDLSSGLTSAIAGGTTSSNKAFLQDATGAITSFGASITPGVSGTTILDLAMNNTNSSPWSAGSSQTVLDHEEQTGGGAFAWIAGYKAASGSGAQSQSYTATPAPARGSYMSIALIPAAGGGGTTLGDLTFTETSARRVPGEAWTASISGRTAGSTITATCPGETVTWNSGTNTLSATFTTPGTKTITLTETLAGATNSPHVSPAQSATILTQVKIAVLGSSTADHWFTTTFTTTETPNARLYAGDGSPATWEPIATYIGAAGKGAGGIAFGNYLLAKLGAGYRVDLLDVALGGTTLLDWSLKAATPGSNYAAMIAAINAVGGVDAAVCHVGSNDARFEAVPSTATHEARYRTLISNLRTDISDATLPFFIMGCQRAPLEPAGSDIYWARARKGEMNVADDSNLYLGTTVVDLPLLSGEDVHLSEGTTGGNAVGARRTAQAVHSALFGGSQRYTGPKPGSASYNAATGWITISFTLASGCELVGRTGQEGLTGFAFLAEGSPVTPVVAPFVSGPAQVAAQLATGLSSVTYSYQEAVAPDVSNCLFDNGPGVPAP